MLLTFLGTAASEGYPDAFCACANCQAARALGGPSLRKRSAALLDDDLLVDLGPDLMAAAQIHATPLDRIRYCLQTHDHHDHLDSSHFLSRSAFSGVTTAPLMEWFASSVSLAKATERLSLHGTLGTLADAEVEQRLNLRFRQIAPGQRFDAGPYRILAVPASHAPEAMLFLIERDGRRLFYATDTGPLSEAAWELLATNGGLIHVVALDHTFGTKDRSTGHLNADQFCEQIDRMRALGLLASDARIFAHHLGHHSNPPHPDLMAFAAARGYEAAYDGLRVEV
jgi:phosphoribosyl 1,2-cyclic phosphate phosphodiesterase